MQVLLNTLENGKNLMFSRKRIKISLEVYINHIIFIKTKNDGFQNINMYFLINNQFIKNVNYEIILKR